MANKRTNNVKKGTAYSRDQKRVDKEYYEGLYNDLPKEVVNILMETHPLMGQNEGDPEATAYRTRRPEDGEVEAVRATRMEQVGKEIAREMGTARKEESPKDQQRYDEPNDAEYYFNEQQDDYPSQMNKDENKQQNNSKVQYVQVNVSQRQDNSQGQMNPAPRKKKKAKQNQEQLYFGENDVENQKYNFQDFDWDAKEKEENLNQLYDDNYEDREHVQLPGKRVMIAGIIAVLIFGICGFSIISLNNKLTKAEKQLQEQTDLSEKYQELQMQKLALEDEIKILKGTDTPDGSQGENGQGASTVSENGEFEIYTALESDTYWSMAAKFYGNGAEYQKILDANGLTEADAVKPGQKYKIPKKE